MFYSIVGISQIAQSQHCLTCWQQTDHVEICCFDQNYQPGKITLKHSVLIIKYLVAVAFG